MEVLFYLFACIAVISAVGVVFNTYPVYALLCLIIHCISLSCIFFILGAYLAGVLEVIIYAGAIMVLFIFVIMMLNVDCPLLVNDSSVVRFSLYKVFLTFIFLVMVLYIVWNESNNFYINNNINSEIITLKNIGIILFGDYILLVEMASMLLLGSLVVSLRIIKGDS